MRPRTSRYAPLAALLVVFSPAGCKSSDGGGDAAAPLTCGDATCAVDQLCVGKQTCPDPTCTPLADGGVCPPGTSATPSCPDGGPPGCFQGCPAAQFSCVARPAGCATVDCSCAAALCAPGTCLETMGNRVACDIP
jgi:hypothetical protein